jgi:hypothetical protein
MLSFIFQENITELCSSYSLIIHNPLFYKIHQGFIGILGLSLDD